MNGLLDRAATGFLTGYFLARLFGVELLAGILPSLLASFLMLRLLGARRPAEFVSAGAAALVGLMTVCSATSRALPGAALLPGEFEARVQRRLSGEQELPDRLILDQLEVDRDSEGVELGLRSSIDLPRDARLPARGRRLRLQGLLETEPDQPLSRSRSSRLRGRLLEADSNALGHRAAGWREALRARLDAHVATPARPWLAALVLGEPLPRRDQRELLRASGAAHFFVVSGLHLGLVAALLVGLLGLLGRERRSALLIALPLALGYAVITGSRPPVMRAFALLVFLVVADRFDRPLRPLRLVVLLAAIALALAPDLADDVSFAFSFLAVAGIAAMRSASRSRADDEEPLLRFLERKRGGRWLPGLRTTLAVSEAAFLATAPMALLVSGICRPAAIPASLLLLPLTALMLVLGALALLVALPEAPLELLARCLEHLLAMLGALPFATIEVGTTPLAAALCSWSALGAAALLRARGRPALLWRLLAWGGFALALLLARVMTPALEIERLPARAGFELRIQGQVRELANAPAGVVGRAVAIPDAEIAGERAVLDRRTIALRFDHAERRLILATGAAADLVDLPWDDCDLLVLGRDYPAREALRLARRFGAESWCSLEAPRPDTVRLLGCAGLQRCGLRELLGGDK